MATRMRRSVLQPANSRVVRSIAARRATHRDEPPDAPGRGGQIIEFDASYALEEALKKARSTPRAHRGGDYLHVSDLIHGCLRKKSLCDKYNVKPRPQILTLGDQFTFAQGDAIHDTAKSIFARATPDTIWGKWKCVCGYLYHDEPCTLAETDTDELCPRCGTPCNLYQEVSMFDEEWKIVGNPDLLNYHRRADAFHVSELKSIAHEQWKELKRPLPDHVLQVIFYWKIMQRLGYSLFDSVSILYITKGWVFGYKAPYIEFVLHAPPEVSRLDDMIEDAIAYRDAKENDTLPLRTRCSTKDSPHAKNCEVCQLCFKER